MAAAWFDSTGNPFYIHENGFYILRDPVSGEISIQPAIAVFGNHAYLGSPPADAIATFHTHSNRTGSPVMVGGKQLRDVDGKPQFYLPGPSDGDMRAARRSGLPGIVMSDRGLYFYGSRLKSTR